MFENLKDNIKPWIFVIIFTIICGVTVTVATRCSDEESDVKATVTMPKIKVYIKGEIKKEGLYEIDGDVRLCELMELAGGIAENADVDRLNLAAILQDGTTIVIPAVGSEEEISPMIAQTNGEIYTRDYVPSSSSGASDKITSGTININSADKSALMRLPGVGEATAEKIISYRQANGSFLSIEEIMNVSGIGEAKFESMKQFITVK